MVSGRLRDDLLERRHIQRPTLALSELRSPLPLFPEGKLTAYEPTNQLRAVRYRPCTWLMGFRANPTGLIPRPDGLEPFLFVRNIRVVEFGIALSQIDDSLN